MQVQKPDPKHPLLALEELDTFTDSIVCQEPTITLKFRSEEAVSRAEKAWSWINNADTNYFYLIANHDGCGPDAMRHPYKVVRVDHDDKNLTTVFTTQNVDWEEVTPNHKMSIGTSTFARRASIPTSASIVRRASSNCFYPWRMLGIFCGSVEKPGPGTWERLKTAFVDGGKNLGNGLANTPSNVANGARLDRIPGALFDAGVTFTNGMKRIPSQLGDAGETLADGVSKIPGEVGQAFSHNFQLASGFVFNITEGLVEDIEKAAGGAKSVAQSVANVVEKIANFEETLLLLIAGKPMTFDFASTAESAEMMLYPAITTGPFEFSSQCQGCSTKGSLEITAEWFMNGGSLLNPIFQVKTKGITGSIPIKHKISADLRATEEDDTVWLFPIPGITPFTIGAVSIGPLVSMGGGFEGKLKVAGAFTSGLNYTIPDGTLELHPMAPMDSRQAGFDGKMDFKPWLDLDELSVVAEASVFGMARIGAGVMWGKGTTVGAWADFKGGLKGTLKLGNLDTGECPANFLASVTGVVGDRIDKSEKVEGKTGGAKAALGTFYEVSVAAGISSGVKLVGLPPAKISFKLVDGGTEIAGFCFAAAPPSSLDEQKMAALQPTSPPTTVKIEKQKQAAGYVQQPLAAANTNSGMILVKGVAPQLFPASASQAGSQAVMV
ncbi:hypothetical protein ABW20_dc0100870 [Dactylellina cionopaga]|nr:hypothetical protein ABW20_dc0100870 [Dactylellina cionopaga]